MLNFLTVFDELSEDTRLINRCLPFRLRSCQPKRFIYMIKKFLKFTIVISAFITSLQSPDLMAQEVVLFVPKSIWESQAKSNLLEQSLTVSKEMGPLQHQSNQPQFSVVAIQSTFAAKLSLTSLVSNGDRSTKIQIDAKELMMVAKKVEFKIFVNNGLGFGLALLRLNVKCESVVVELSPPISLQATIGFSGGATERPMTFDQINFQLNPDLLKVQLNGCTDVSGFDELLKTNLAEWIKSEVLVNLAKEVLNQEANSWLKEKMDQVLNQTLKKYNFSTAVNSSLDQDGDLWIVSPTTNADLLTDDDLNQIKKYQIKVLLLSVKAIEKNISNVINKKLETVQISSDNVSGLKKISCSRFYQFFLWPALMLLDKCFPLQFVNKSTLVKLIDLKNLTFEIDINSWAQNRDGQNPNKDLAFFQTRFLAALKTSRTELLNFSGQGFPEFAKRSHHSGRISTNFVKSSIEKLLTETVNEFRKDTDLQKILNSTTVKIFKDKRVIIELN